MKRLALAVVFLSCLTAPARAGIDEGLAAYERGDYATALQEWAPLANQGDAEAQYFLGHMYVEGQGVPRQYGKAAVWIRQAAEQGNGYGQFALGYLYDKGTGVAQDDAEAARWYRKSAEQGNTVAQNNLGIMYEHGRGVPQDYVRAYLWYDLSVSLPGADRSKAVRNLDEIARKMTPAEIAEAQRLALEWWRR